MKIFNGKYSRLAYKTAKKAHKGQTDKTGAPYILHPVRVANYTQSEDDEVNAIALLHDVLEDTQLTIIELQNLGFTPRIINAVILLTRLPGVTYFDYIWKIANSGNRDAIKVKLADLRDNSDADRIWAVENPESMLERYKKARKILQDALTDITGIGNMLTFT